MLEQMLSSFIYYPDPHWIAKPARLSLKAEEVRLEPETGIRLHAWFFPHPEPLASLLFCHGNAGNASHRLPNVRELVDTGFQVLLFDYRGYGHSSGAPSGRGTLPRCCRGLGAPDRASGYGGRAAHYLWAVAGRGGGGGPGMRVRRGR